MYAIAAPSPESSAIPTQMNMAMAKSAFGAGLNNGYAPLVRVL